MDASSFDAWTRRRLGLALGGTITSLLSAKLLAEGVAGKRHKNKNLQKRCKRLGDSCTIGGKRKCCTDLRCDNVGLDSIAQTFCCHGEGHSCTVEQE